MKSKKILYALNGTGSGHITRARQIIPFLKEHYKVDILISGKNNIIDSMLDEKYNFRGFTFIINKKGKVSYLRSIFGNNILKFFKDIISLNLNNYDLVISDFEPISAWASKIKGKPSVQLSHQCSLFSRKSPRPKKIDYLAEFFIRWYGPCNKNIGFHFKKYDNHILGPLLRNKIIHAKPKEGDYYVVYLWNYSSDYIANILSKFDHIQFKIFDSKAHKVLNKKNCEIIPTGDDVFFNAILNCKGVICGAGFELPSEVIYLKKKLYVIPIGNQYEQKCNAQALIDMGIDSFNKLESKNLKQWLEKKIHQDINIDLCSSSDVVKMIKNVTK